jgi:hypothetical protein
MKRAYFAVVFALFVAVALASGQATAHGDLSAADIERMLSAKVPADVIALKVKQAGKPFNLGAEDIIALKKAGTSDALLRLMLDPAGTSGGGSAAEGHDLTIPDGTEVKLLLKNPLSSATAQSEQRIDFTASDAVVVHGVTVIEKGAPAVGHVTEVEARKSFGRKGKLAFTIDTVQAVSGEHVRLRAS